MQGKDLTVYFVTIGLMILLVMGLGIAIYVLRGRLFGDHQGPNADAGSVLEAMRAMRERGEIPEEEYRAAQAALVAKTAARRPQPPSKSVGGRTMPPSSSERRAAPGFDLTGEPLPRPVRDRDDNAGEAAR